MVLSCSQGRAHTLQWPRGAPRDIHGRLALCQKLGQDLLLLALPIASLILRQIDVPLNVHLSSFLNYISCVRIRHELDIWLNNWSNNRLPGYTDRAGTNVNGGRSSHNRRNMWITAFYCGTSSVRGSRGTWFDWRRLQAEPENSRLPGCKERNIYKHTRIRPSYGGFW